MSLRNSYGLITALSEAYQAGKDYVSNGTPTYDALEAGLAAASAEGKTNFTITAFVTHAPSTLRLKGKYWKTFVEGVIAGLGEEDIFDYEVTIELNTYDTVDTKIDFNFHFLFSS